MRPERVFHFSEDPDIKVFAPHQAKTAQVLGEWVWAVDEQRAPSYWFPRDCPRATFWPAPGGRPSYAAESLLAGASRVHAIDWRWMDSLLDCDLFVYTFDGTTFRPTEEVFGAEGRGFWVSEETVTPIDVQRVGPLLHRHAEAGVELRAVKDLAALWQRVITTPGLDFSGIRLRNL